MVEQPAKVMRIGTMIKQLLEEVRAAPLDEAGRHRLREIHESSIRELEQGLAPELREELDRLTLPFGTGVPSEAELRIAQAQLVGWLEGLFHGIQTALFAQQMAARQQLEMMRGRALPGAPGEQVIVGPGGQILTPPGRSSVAAAVRTTTAGRAPASTSDDAMRLPRKGISQREEPPPRRGRAEGASGARDPPSAGERGRPRDTPRRMSQPLGSLLGSQANFVRDFVDTRPRDHLALVALDASAGAGVNVSPTVHGCGVVGGRVRRAWGQAGLGRAHAGRQPGRVRAEHPGLPAHRVATLPCSEQLRPKDLALRVARARPD